MQPEQTPAPARGTETPRTDVVRKAIKNLGHDKYELALKHADELERELSSAQEQIAALREAVEKLLRRDWHRGMLMLDSEDKVELEAALAATRKEEGNG